MTCAFITPPDDFHPTLDVAGCYCEHAGKLLFLKRAPKKPRPDTWCIPGGKLEVGETPLMAAIRETDEEIGVSLDEKGLEDVGTVYIRLPHVDFTFYRFRTVLKTRPKLTLALDEHVEAKWVTLEEALQLPLMPGGVEALLHYRDWVAGRLV